MTIYDDANKIKEKLRKTKEFNDLQDAYEQIKENPKAFKLFKKFQKLQMEFGQKQMQGEAITEEDFEKMNKLTEKIQKSNSINNYLQKNQLVINLINELSSIISDPLQEFYRD